MSEELKPVILIKIADLVESSRNFKKEGYITEETSPSLGKFFQLFDEKGKSVFITSPVTLVENTTEGVNFTTERCQYQLKYDYYDE